MARPIEATTQTIVAVLTANPEITYQGAVDQGLIDPNKINTARFNVTKHNWKKKKIVALGGTPKLATPKPPKAKSVADATAPKTRKPRTVKLVNVPVVGDLTTAMKSVADAGGLAKAKARIAELTALQAAVASVESTQATLAKIA
jgi:hypothetical protein